MRLWPWIGAAGFFLALGLFKAWRDRASATFWLRAWAVWIVAAFLFGSGTARILQRLELSPSLWLQHWSRPDWQLNLWYLASLPLFLALSSDLRAEKGGFERSALALALGAALAPLALNAFPLAQLVSVLTPFAVLALLSRFLPRSRSRKTGPLWALAGLNLLGFAHGVVVLPAWLGSALLAACLAWGLNPYGPAAAKSGAALAIAGLSLKFFVELPAAASTALACLLIAAGWLLRLPPAENDLAQTP